MTPRAPAPKRDGTSAREQSEKRLKQGRGGCSTPSRCFERACLSSLVAARAASLAGLLLLPLGCGDDGGTGQSPPDDDGTSTGGPTASQGPGGSTESTTGPSTSADTTATGTATASTTDRPTDTEAESTETATDTAGEPQGRRWHRGGRCLGAVARRRRHPRGARDPREPRRGVRQLADLFHHV